MSSSSIMDSFFQRSLDDLIKSLRLSIPSESTLISKSLEEIRKELKSTDLQIKSIALEKLTYLNSLYSIDMNFASFHVVEVMSSPKFSQKRIGYLAASQSFHQDTDVILLITNQLRKDLNSGNEFEVSLGLECLSVIATHDLARDLMNEIFVLLASSKIFVKKKAIGVVFRVFGKYPDSVKVVFKRLVENLENSMDHNVVLSAVIGVFCELSNRDPKSYLPLAPEFYRILVDSKNNWVLIKALKIFANLGVLEPRLAKRIVEPICEILRRTTAKSLMFECIRTVATCLSEYEAAVKLAVEKVRELLNDEDPNLKYLGLKALSILGSKHLWAVVENKEVVIKSLSDADPNIRHESLYLVMEMVSEDNVVEISRVLLNYALKSDPDFSNEILGSILSTCGRNVYEVIVDFDWYVSFLGEMVRNPHWQKGVEIEHQFVDIGMRVKEVRPELVHVVRDLLIDPALLGNPFLHRILSASAWVSGEYVEFSKNPFELIEALLQPRTNLLPPMIRAVYIQSAFKVLVFCLHLFFVRRQPTASSSLDDLSQGMFGLNSERELREGQALVKDEDSSASFDSDQNEEFILRGKNRTGVDIDKVNGGNDTVTHGHVSYSDSAKEPFTGESVVYVIGLLKTAMSPLSGNDEVEVQERARNVLGLVELLQQETSGWLTEKDGSLKEEEIHAFKVIEMLHGALSQEIGPVSMTSQERVPIPEGLNLNENLADLDSICGDVLSPPSGSFSMGDRLFTENYGGSSLDLHKQEDSEQSTESTSLLAQHRKRHGLYYLQSERNESASNDYPPANDPQSADTTNDGARDLLMITEKSLPSRTKQSRSKMRPVVIKLDEKDDMPVSTVKPWRDTDQDELSGAVRSILLGQGDKPASSKSKSSGVGTSSSRRSKQRSHVKEREISPMDNDENKEGNNQKDKKKSHRHSRNKTRHRADLPLNVVAQTPVIPDFLL